jgi:hypothetical protein
MSSTVSTPDAWLRQLLAVKQRPQRQMALHLGIDETTFGRYVNGDESIPRVHLGEIARYLAPGDFKFVMHLKMCEDYREHVERQARKLAKECALTASPAPFVLALADDLVRGIPPQQRPYRFAAVLADAAIAIQIFFRWCSSNFHAQLIAPQSVERFRYPVNHFLGELLELDAHVPADSPDQARIMSLRKAVTDGLRRQLSLKQSKKHLKEIGRQFSLHLVARHGDADAQEELRHALTVREREGEPLLRRICYTGLLLSRKDEELADRFCYGLETDAKLSEANVRFNAFHYGDVHFDSGGYLQLNARSMRAAVPHVLRHIERPSEYRRIQDAEYATFAQLIDRLGTRAINRPDVVARLTTVLDRQSMAGRGKDEEPYRRFRDVASRALKESGALPTPTPGTE